VTALDPEYEAIMASDDPPAAALLLFVRAYRARTDFFRSTMPVIKDIGEANDRLAGDAKSFVEDTLAELGLKRPKIRPQIRPPPGKKED